MIIRAITHAYDIGICLKPNKVKLIIIIMIFLIKITFLTAGILAYHIDYKTEVLY